MRYSFLLSVFVINWLMPALARAEKGDVDIMINMNLSFKEEDAAVAAANARGERLIVIPKLTAAQKSSLEGKKKVFDKVECKYHSLTSNSPDIECPTSKGETLEVVQTLKEKLRNEIVNIVAGYDPRFKALVDADLNTKTVLPDLLKDELLQLGPNEKLSALILSGHSAMSGFNGIMGGLSKAQLEAIKQDPKVKEQFDNAKDLLMWGCYSTTVLSVNDYLALFPNSRMIAGFEGRGPTQNRQGDMDYLTFAMKEAANLGSKSSGDRAADKQAVVKTLSKAQETLNAMHTSILVCKGADEEDRYFYHHDKSGARTDNYKELMSACQNSDGSDSKEVTALIKNFENVMGKYVLCLKDPSKIAGSVVNAESVDVKKTKMFQPAFGFAIERAQSNGMPEIDVNCKWPDPGSGEIRQLYNEMSRLSYCPNLSMQKIFPEDPEHTLNTILYLTKFQSFMPNWFNQYGSKIEEYNRAHPDSPIQISASSNRGKVVQEITSYFEREKANRKTASQTPGTTAPAPPPPGQMPADFKPPERGLNDYLIGLLYLDAPEFNLNWI